jgi:hypothetical protein
MLALWNTSSSLRRLAKEDKYPEQPMMIGILERGLYCAAWQFGRAEFVAVWLTLKFAGQWNVWTHDPRLAGHQVAGRNVFNLFLIGNGFSIAYGVVGALLAEWLAKRMFLPAISVPATLVCATGVFWAWGKLVQAKLTRRDENAVANAVDETVPKTVRSAGAGKD